jgi:hypothetical protein
MTDSCAREKLYEFTYGTFNGMTIVNGATRVDGVWGGFEHDYILEETGDPCWKGQVCSICGEHGENIENHATSQHIVTEPTCAQKGVMREYCLNCYWYERLYTVEPLGHEFVGSDGQFTCVRCGLESAENNPYIIRNAGQLALALARGGNSKCYKLAADIWLNDIEKIEVIADGRVIEEFDSVSDHFSKEFTVPESKYFRVRGTGKEQKRKYEEGCFTPLFLLNPLYSGNTPAL